MRESIDENQREYYLREKLRAIKEELGDSVPKEDDAESIREELQKNSYPQYVKDKIEEELKEDLKQCQQHQLSQMLLEHTLIGC